MHQRANSTALPADDNHTQTAYSREAGKPVSESTTAQPETSSHTSIAGHGLFSHPKTDSSCSNETILSCIVVGYTCLFAILYYHFRQTDDAIPVTHTSWHS